MLATGLETTKNIHHGWAWVVIIANGLAGVWALSANWLTQLRTRALWWFIGAAEVSVFVQVILGALLVGKYKVKLPQFHVFYGFVAIVSIAIHLQLPIPDEAPLVLPLRIRQPVRDGPGHPRHAHRRQSLTFRG